MDDRANIVEQAEQLYRAIGMAVVNFQQIEQWLAEELALLLRMRDKDDQHLVSAAMSFGQKVDLLVNLFPKRAVRHPNLPVVDVAIVKKALEAAEEYRNRVVHSFYAIECDDESRWIRIKGSLRGRKGFSLNSVEVNVAAFDECNDALKTIRGWSLTEPGNLVRATELLKKHMRLDTPTTGSGLAVAS
jgi:hypothetical protein